MRMSYQKNIVEALGPPDEWIRIGWDRIRGVLDLEMANGELVIPSVIDLDGKTLPERGWSTAGMRVAPGARYFVHQSVQFALAVDNQRVRLWFEAGADAGEAMTVVQLRDLLATIAGSLSAQIVCEQLREVHLRVDVRLAFSFFYQAIKNRRYASTFVQRKEIRELHAEEASLYFGTNSATRLVFYDKLAERLANAAESHGWETRIELRLPSQALRKHALSTFSSLGTRAVDHLGVVFEDGLRLTVAESKAGHRVPTSPVWKAIQDFIRNHGPLSTITESSSIPVEEALGKAQHGIATALGVLRRAVALRAVHPIRDCVELATLLSQVLTENLTQADVDRYNAYVGCRHP